MTKKVKSFNPCNGELIGEVQATDILEIEKIVIVSQNAQKKWKEINIDKRIEALEKVGTLLSMRASEMGEILSMEMGKGLRRGISEVQGSGSSISYTSKLVKDAIKPHALEGYGIRTTVEHLPLGVCGIITPWNYPVSMAHWMIIPALVSGNSVILKPSEETTLVSLEYVKAFQEVLPENVIQIIIGDEEQGEALVKSDVNFIGFTGSKETGKRIMQNAAVNMKRLMMELGGKDPLIVMKDANINKAASFAVGNSLENAGQMCISTERIFVDNHILSEFEKKVINLTSQYKIGAYNDAKANIGPIINEKQRSIILSQIEDALAQGATLLYGGEPHPDRYIKPTVLTNVTDNMKIAKEETFGPVVCITPFEKIEEAIKSANHAEYGLGAVVFGKEGVEDVAKGIEAGMVGINMGSGGVGDTPWVGIKQSGYGYHGSPDGHRQFTLPKVTSTVL